MQNGVVFSNDAIIIDRIVADYDYWMNLMERLEHFSCHTRTVAS